MTSRPRSDFFTGSGAKFELNDVIDSPPHPWAALFRETAKDPMLWFFAGTGVVHALVGQWTESLTLLVAILSPTGMDVYLHRRTQASTEGLRPRLALIATVIRNGESMSAPVVDLVPGDLVEAHAGEPISANGIFRAANHAQVDQSAQTVSTRSSSPST